MLIRICHQLTRSLFDERGSKLELFLTVADAGPIPQKPTLLATYPNFANIVTSRLGVV